MPERPGASSFTNKIFTLSEKSDSVGRGRGVFNGRHVDGAIKLKLFFGQIRRALGARSSSRPEILTRACQACSTFKRANNASCEAARPASFKTCPSKGLSCVSAAVMSLWKPERMFKKKHPKKPVTVLQISPFPFKSGGRRFRNPKRSLANGRRWETKTSPLPQQRLCLHSPHAQVTSCASWTCDISKCHWK